MNRIRNQTISFRDGCSFVCVDFSGPTKDGNANRLQCVQNAEESRDPYTYSVAQEYISFVYDEPTVRTALTFFSSFISDLDTLGTRSLIMTLLELVSFMCTLSAFIDSFM